jgi:hypothetical protein
MELLELQTCRAPSEWPAAPAELSVSSLTEIEQCPRRWSLRNAQYQGIWARKGYPTAPSPAALAGSAVHLALEWITRELVQAGCESAQGSAAVAVLRRLGGYTVVVERAALKLLGALQENPRVAARAGVLKRSVLRQVPQLRERVQKLLSRLRLMPKSSATAAKATAAPKRPLGKGSYAEVRLHAPRIGWRGTADLLTVVEAGCEIADFKTGDTAGEHSLQLQVYALLWYRDSELNPEATLAQRLIISYSNADVDVAPLGEAELNEFERTLVARSDTARQRLGLHPPPAVPGPEACAWCPVRHLCAEYWRPATLRQVRPVIEAGERYEDLELELLEPHSPGMWSAAVRASSSLEKGDDVKLQIDASHAAVMQSGRFIRVVGARIIELEDFDAEAPETLIAPSAWTEVFVLDSGLV